MRNKIRAFIIAPVWLLALIASPVAKHVFQHEPPTLMAWAEHGSDLAIEGGVVLWATFWLLVLAIC